MFTDESDEEPIRCPRCFGYTRSERPKDGHPQARCLRCGIRFTPDLRRRWRINYEATVTVVTVTLMVVTMAYYTWTRLRG